MSDKQETVADIVAEMRKLCSAGRESDPTISGQLFRINIYRLADRLEAAWKREVGNGAKMREALEFLIKHKEWLRGFSLTMTLEDLEIIDRILGKAEAALAAPPRNCDVGTAREQKMRMWMFCKGRHCDDCVFRYTLDCRFDWAQMPYEEGGAK